MTNKKRKITVLNEDKETKVNTACNQWTKLCGAGEVKLNVKLNNNRTYQIKLTNVLYVSALRNNLILISVRELTCLFTL